MKIKVDIDKLLLFSMLLTCMFNGIVIQVIFWIILISMYMRGKKLDASEEQNKYVTVIIVYGVLFLIQLFFNKSTGFNSIRLFGLTRALMGISLLSICGARYKNVNTIHLLLWMSTLINVTYFIQDRFGFESTLTSFATINLATCIGLIIAPYLFVKSQSSLHRTAKVFFVFSYALLGVTYMSSTYIMGTSIFVLFIILYFLSKFVNDDKAFKKVRNFLILAIAIVIILFLFYVPLRMRYVSLLYNLDEDRANILEGAFKAISSFTSFEKIFGSGNNIFLHRVRYLEAHNAVIECFMIYGGCGILGLIIETISFIRINVVNNRNKSYHWLCIASISLAYLCYMMHPFFSSSFLTKIFLVMPLLYISHNNMLLNKEETI